MASIFRFTLCGSIFLTSSIVLAGNIEKLSIDRKKAVLSVTDEEFEQIKVNADLPLYFEGRRSPIRSKVVEKTEEQVTVILSDDTGKFQVGSEFQLIPYSDNKTKDVRLKPKRILSATEWGDEIVVACDPREAEELSEGQRVYLRSEKDFYLGYITKVEKDKATIKLDTPLKSNRINQTITFISRKMPFYPPMSHISSDKYLAPSHIGIELDYGKGSTEFGKDVSETISFSNLRLQSAFKFGRDGLSFFSFGFKRSTEHIKRTTKERSGTVVIEETEIGTSPSQTDLVLQFGGSFLGDWTWGAGLEAITITEGENSASGFRNSLSILNRWSSGHAGIGYTPAASISAKEGDFKTDNIYSLSIWQRLGEFNIFSQTDYDSVADEKPEREKAKIRSRLGAQYWIGFYQNIGVDYFYNYRDFGANADEISTSKISASYSIIFDEYALSLTPSYITSSGKYLDADYNKKSLQVMAGIYYLMPDFLASKRRPPTFYD